MAKAVWAVFLLLLGMLGASEASRLSTRYDENSGEILIVSNEDGLEIQLAYIPVDRTSRSSTPRHVRYFNGEVFDFGNSNITIQRQDRAGRCLGVYQWVNTPKTVLKSCQNHLTSHIYGGTESTKQVFLTEQRVYDNYAFVTNQTQYAGIATRYWLFSDGRFVRVHSNVPLFIDQNTDQSPDALCFTAKNQSPYPEDRPDNLLQWDICSFGNAREAHEHAVQKYLGKPAGVPDERMVTHPVWATLARYDIGVNDSLVRDLANEIIANGFKNSNIEIDDIWETCYGSLTFDPNLFRDIRALTDELHSLGFRVTLWVHPFLNRGCEPYYSEAVEKGYLVSNVNGSTITRWYHGVTGVVDFTNPEAVTWWTSRLWALRNESGIDSFDFGYGEVSFLPKPSTIEPVERNPVAFSDAYAKVISQFGPMVQIETSVDNQQLPNYFVMDKMRSDWTNHHGFKTLIPKLLQLNLVGYPFVIGEMVGGGNSKTWSELYVRWLQASVFMPVVKYSFTPWDFDNETLEICRSLTDLHTQYAPRILELMQKAVEDGTPVNLPVWWLDPTDSTAQTIDSEYLLGEDVLVAPVLHRNSVRRDIYLPKGTWRDEADPEHPTIQGPTWLRKYPAPLNTLPYFTRISSS
ncbi:myogenesis-regulating glycosidase-like [Schistocerca cancellata]|uniref:myogenesis-regulating glycosidase-like n=1 Tax=Schistocerca cancellata TaxID=274614 RepID=UPI002119A38B|nr:myogenesis-regulating glycosidase-like [Schistocerca cancellata]